MSDLIFYTNGEETSRIPFPTPGTKCPETKLEIKMTETDISKVLIEGDYATIMGVKYKRVEEPKPKMKFLFDGKCEVVSYNKKSYYRFEFPDEVYWYRRTSHETYLDLKLERITDGETHRLLEGVWFNDVKHGKYEEPYCPDEPSWYDEVEWDEKDNPPKPTSSEFRQKLFDGIKSVFYDPEYERTHWKMKVDMAVDEVLTHFYDIIPEPREPVCDEFVKGWNCCLAEIKVDMEFSDD